MAAARDRLAAGTSEAAVAVSRRAHRVLQRTARATLLTALLWTPSWAGPITGRLSTELYTYNRDDSSHVRPYVRLSADWNLWRGTKHRSLTLISSLRWTSDFQDRLSADPQLFVYDAYLRLANPVPNLTLDVGRQFAYAGVGSAHIDGVRARFDHRRVQVEAYGGNSVSRLDPEEVRSFKDFGAWGAQVLVRPVHRGRFGVHVAGRNDFGSLARHLAGATAEWDDGRWNLYGRYAFDLIANRSATLLGRVRYGHAAWTVEGEYSHREPAVAANSIFSIIDASAYDQVRASARRRVKGAVSVVAGLSYTSYDQGSVWRSRLGVSSPAYSLFGLLQTGDRGDLAGVQGHLSPYSRGRLQPYLRFSVNRYAVQEEQGEKSDAHTVAAGAAWRGRGARTLRGEVQWLRNATEKGSARLFVQFAQGFRWNPGGGK